MKRCGITSVFLLSAAFVYSQELYVFSEPASNMPAKSIAAKITSRFADLSKSSNYKQRYMPELMFGVNKNWMVHVSGTFSDFYSSQLRAESVKGYAKWRFFSNDDVHKHFRMAAFAEGAYTRNPFVYGDLNLDGDNSGIQAGLIATQLVHKFAVSATGSVIKVYNKRDEHMHHVQHSDEAFVYSLSAGYLLFPRSYTNYNQTNLNLYVELLGMQGFDYKDHMLDIAPALQLIFNSNFKINVGARLQVNGDMERISNRNYFISLERTFLGALKSKKKK